jgi:hypothetical protein
VHSTADEPLPCEERHCQLTLCHCRGSLLFILRISFHCQSVVAGGVPSVRKLKFRFVAEAGNRSVQGGNAAVIRRIA